MGLFEHIRKRLGGLVRSKDRTTPRTGSPRLTVSAPGNVVGVNTPDAALCLAAVYRCAKFIGDAVANLPLHYQHKSGGVFVDCGRDSLEYLISAEPNAEMSSFDFWYQAVQHMLFMGNAYIFPRRDRYGLYELVLCTAYSCTYDPDTKTYNINDSINDIYGSYSTQDVIHLRGVSVGRGEGVSILEYARRTFETAATGDTETLDRFATGGRAKVLLSPGSPMAIYGEDAEEEKQRLAKKLDGSLGSEGWVTLLPAEYKAQLISLSSADMQFLQSRQFTTLDICRFFGVPPIFVFHDSSSNYKSAEMANVAFLSNTLNPMLRKIEMELERKLIGRDGWGKYRFRFDRRGIYACDLDSKARYYSQMIAAGIYSPNDCRALENMPPVESGDKVYISANLKPIDTIEDNEENTERN